MILQVPLFLFLVLCVVMIVALANNKDADSIDTVEALCDAILREDIKTQKTLTSLPSIELDVIEALAQIRDKHIEIAKSYGASIENEWEDNTSSFTSVRVPIESKNQSIKFKCRKTVNQWLIIGIEIDSSKKSSS